ncbi:MAG: ATP-binding protein [Fibrobacteria bacterium]|nr:ATP-binding protein [Fibrobacteria bacterium]
MKRVIHKALLDWKSSENRKPLLLKGTRQVGKTWSLKNFGNECYAKTHYLNFQDSNRLKSLFEDGYEVKKVIQDIENYLQAGIDIHKDLLIFDEIQDCPQAITSLKYFCENIPELSLCCAGSHLGVTLAVNSFPVGKINSLSMYPVTFQEYLLNKNKRLYESLLSAGIDNKLSSITHGLLWDELKTYYVIGGLPEIVQFYLEHQKNLFTTYTHIRKMQKELIENYRSDFAKHSGKVNANHINGVYDNIPSQIQKVHDGSVKRYQFKDVLPNKTKYSQLAGPIDWLVHAGLLLKVSIANNAEIPLDAYCKQNMFKLYLFDTGLLGAQMKIPVESILKQDYGTFKGFFAENFVAQELNTIYPNELYSWTKNNSEIEFVLTCGTSLVPVEVKSGSRVKAKSLQSFKKRYEPSLSVKLSALNIDIQGGQSNYPIYMAGMLSKFLLHK